MRTRTRIERRPSSGTTAWLVIFSGAAAFDTWAILHGKETLSSAVWRMSEDPLGRVLLYSFWAGLTYHLFAEKPFPKKPNPPE